MEKQYKQIDDVATGESVRIELTEEEYTDLAERQKEAANAEILEKEKFEAAEKAKKEAELKLASIGLTLEDFKALGLG